MKEEEEVEEEEEEEREEEEEEEAMVNLTIEGIVAVALLPRVVSW